MGLTLEKGNNSDINLYIDECYKIQDFINSLNKDNVKESKEKVFSMCNKLINEIKNSDLEEAIKNDMLKQIQEELLNYFTTKYFFVGFD